MTEVKLTITELKELLTEQKKLTTERLLSHTYEYNPETTDGNLVPMKINETKFMQKGMSAEFPNDFNVLRKYIK